jgi:tetratricopeptide (TPR) repeat protein/transcriptional regulator with XRE-family HTH domain
VENQEEDFADLLGRYLDQMGFTQQELANKIGVHRNTIVNWLNRTSQPPRRGQVLRLADELALPKQERKVLIQTAGFSLERWPTEIWTVPQQRDMFFTGRDHVFQSLREFLVPGSTTALTQAISGLGGIGKTHTAVEYTYRFHQDYEAVIWLQADSWEVLVSACVKLADILELPKQKEAALTIAEVQRWLQKHRHWLLILDNVENPQELLLNFVPTGHQGYVLITTRVHNVEPLAQTLVLSRMPEEEGILFLLRRTKKIASVAGWEQADTVHHDGARRIWQIMDGLPLALDQAGAYILETQCSFSAYETRYEQRRNELLNRRGKRFIGHEESVATTFSLAFERTEVLNPMAADILRACSVLHYEAIPEEFFLTAAEHLGTFLAANIENWDLAIGVLLDYSLIQRNVAEKTLTMHRLVQAVLQDTMPEQEHKTWSHRAIIGILTIFPKEVEYSTWNQCERCLPHALACADMIEQEKLVPMVAVYLLRQAGWYLDDRARYQEAEPLYKRALAINELQSAPEPLTLATLLNHLGLLYDHQGKYDQAEALYNRALAIREQQLEPDLLEIAIVLHNLGLLYDHQGKYDQAEALYNRALAIREQQLESDDSAIGTLLNDLAGLYRTKGESDLAESFLVRALQISKQQLGPEHPDTLCTLNNLALFYGEQGKYEQAELLHKRVLEIRERLLGSMHPQTASSLYNLAYLYQEQGNYKQAEPLHKRALEICEQALGIEHPDTAQSLSNLGRLYLAQGDYELAEPLIVRALHICEQQLGPEHPGTIFSLHSLAALYFAQGKYKEAEPLLRQALRHFEQQFGPHHPKTLALSRNYSLLLQAMIQEAGPNQEVTLVTNEADIDLILTTLRQIDTDSNLS